MTTNPLDEIAARVTSTEKMFSDQNDLMPTHYKDRSKMLAALRAVEAVMAGWQYDELIEPADDLKEAISEALA